MEYERVIRGWLIAGGFAAYALVGWLAETLAGNAWTFKQHEDWYYSLSFTIVFGGLFLGLFAILLALAKQARQSTCTGPPSFWGLAAGPAARAGWITGYMFIWFIPALGWLGRLVLNALEEGCRTGSSIPDQQNTEAYRAMLRERMHENLADGNVHNPFGIPTGPRRDE